MFKLATVSGSLTLDGLPDLATLNAGPAGLTAIGGDYTVHATGLTAVPPLPSLASVGGALALDDNPALADVSPLYDLGSVAGDLHVTGNPALADADAQALATSIGSVGGAVTIEDNGP
jgi:hypothetical protein